MIPSSPFCFHSDFCLQYQEYDSWDAIADYVFQAIPFPMLPPDHLTFSMEEFRRCLRIDAPPRFGWDPYGKANGHSGF